VDCIDAEVKASGLTKQMEKDLLVEMDIDKCEDNEEEEEEEENDEEWQIAKEDVENIESMRLQVEKAIEDFDNSRKECLRNEVVAESDDKM
jgi:hypothetical protein